MELYYISCCPISGLNDGLKVETAKAFLFGMEDRCPTSRG